MEHDAGAGYDDFDRVREHHHFKTHTLHPREISNSITNLETLLLEGTGRL